MLGKTKKPENETPVAVEKKEIVKPPAPPAPSASSAPSAPSAPSPQPDPKTTEEKTTIGPHISIEGKIHGHEHLVIQGSLKGNVAMDKHNFTVGADGRVDGEIQAQNVSVAGQLQGKINASGSVEITKEADFFGDIEAKSISVEDGAYFKGSIELNREPHRKTNFAAGPKGRSGPDTAKTALSPSTDTRKES